MGIRIALACAAAITAALALSSCATLNEEQCQVTDWRVLGQTDGSQGRPQSYVAQHQSACTRFGIPVDATAWTAGWQQGTVPYCTPTNGLNVGRAGRTNFNACPADSAAQFNEAYNAGRAVYDARTSRDRLQRELNALIAALPNVAPADLPVKQTEIELKRNAVTQAQLQVTSAERAADLFQSRLLTRQALQ
ncbi:MAG: DUF2799 domain-containing protein [Pseudomonadota bacterium]